MSTHDKRAAAVALARRGFRVFKLVDGHKRPLSAGFSDLASNDITIVHRRWSDPVSGEAQDYNPAIATDEYLVIDVDVKNGLRGFDSLAVLEDYGLDTNTLTARTPTGGAHLFYRLPPGVRVQLSNGRRLGEGLDVRGYHGLVVGAGAVFPNGAYEWANDVPMLDAPQWLIDMCGQPPVRAEKAGKVLGDLDTDANIARATVYLTEDAPIARIGSANATTYAVAARVADYGISEHKTFELLQDHYLDDKCEGTWDDQALMDTIHNAYAYRNEPVGWRNPEAEFEAVTIIDRRTGQPAEQPKPKPRLHYVRFEESAALALIEGNKPLIKGLLDCGAMSVLYGASNVGKTFVALDLAFHVAAGLPWRGRSTTKAAVVYVAAEAGRGIHRRVAALRQHYAAEIAALEARGESVTLSIVPCPIDLRDDKGDTEALIGLIKAAAAAMGAEPGLVFIDTLSRAIAGGDENSSVDMGAFVKHADRLRGATKAHTSVVHHSGKDTSKGARGHSLLRAAADTEIEIADGRIEVTKQREMEGGQVIGFRLKEVILGADPDGDIITSCVLAERVVDDDGLPALTEEEKQWDELLLKGLEKMSEERGVIISKCEFGHEFIRSSWQGDVHLTPVRKSLSKQAISKRMGQLSTKGRYKKVSKTQWVRIVSTVSTSVH